VNPLGDRGESIVRQQKAVGNLHPAPLRPM
jgi:hypothetical protein